MASTSRDKDSIASTPARNLKHQWTPVEDEKLVKSLYELYTMGTWKCDTSFKFSYFLQVEKILAQKIPGFGVRATLHIESHVKTLKKQTMAIANMFTIGSGFSRNNEDKMVQAEKSVFNLWVKTHPAAKGLRNKPFPHYDTLLEIFGKDRANALGATPTQRRKQVKQLLPMNSMQVLNLMMGLNGKDISSDSYMVTVFLNLPNDKRKEMVFEVLKDVTIRVELRRLIYED
ncbi:hypothetical protein L1049_026903 [Liquidambar formosana]|uniref:Uncharacterized protein n=1 Tax=Liquidambar formosana TaxID=63359 RepID=A0AAP0NEK2_LIQFO